MLWNERLCLLSAVLCSVVWCDVDKNSDRKGRHLFALLGYLHGYKVGQDFALQIPQYIITPVVVLPSVNQQQSVTIQQGGQQDNYQENGETVQKIPNSKIVLPVDCKHKDDFVKEMDEENQNIETQHLTPVGLDNNVTDTLRQGLENIRNGTVNTNTTENNVTNFKNTTAIDSFKNNTKQTTETPEIPIQGTITNGTYPSPSYNNQMINLLTLTTSAPSADTSQSLPPVSDNRWQNFTLRANLSSTASVEENNNQTMMNGENNTAAEPVAMKNVTEKPAGSGGSYPSAWYNNEAIDQLSITTNYYANEVPPQTHDGWGSYSPMNTLPSGFRPLAGLYYDGFIHAPVKKYGFAPQNYWK